MLKDLKESRGFLWILEVVQSADVGDPPRFIAHLPDFNMGFGSEPAIGSGCSEEEALSRLTQHLKARIAELLSRGVSVPTAIYTSLEHNNQVEEATDGDNQHVIASGKLDVSWPAGDAPQTDNPLRGVLASQTSKCYTDCDDHYTCT